MNLLPCIVLSLLLPVLSFTQELLYDSVEAVVVTAQRQSTTIFESAEAIATLNQQQLNSRVSRSTAEALIGLTGVWMQKTNHGGGSPFIRGLTGNQTLLMIDGIRLNNSTYRYGPNQYFNTIDVLNIRQVEALRGAGSVLYGSDALGGTIQVLTKEGHFSEDKATIHGSLLGRWISNDMELGGRAELNFSSPKVSVLGGFSYRDFGDLRAGGELGIEAPSAYQEQAADFKLKAKLGDQAIVTLAYNGVFQSNVGRYDQVAQRGYQTYMFDPQNRQLTYARLEMEGPGDWLDHLKITTAWQNSLEERRKQLQDDPFTTIEKDKVNTLSAIVEATSDFSKKWKAVSGIEFYRDLVNSSKLSQNNNGATITFGRGLYPNDSEMVNLAVFTSHTLNFSPFKLNFGARYNYFDVQIQDEIFGNTSIQPKALVGNISGYYAFHPKHAVIASINSGFRAPNINDLSSFGGFDFGIEVPGTSLDPERSITYEVGYKASTSKLEANAALYYLKLYDLITRVAGTYQGSSTFEGENVYFKTNTAKAFISGFELDALFYFSRQFSLFGSMTYTYGEDEAKREPLRRIPPLNGRLSIQFQTRNKFFSVLECWYASEQTRLSGGDRSDHRIAEGGTPGWAVFNLNLGCQWSHVRIYGGLQNLFDTAYRMHGSGVDGAGWHVWFRLKGWF